MTNTLEPLRIELDKAKQEMAHAKARQRQASSDVNVCLDRVKRIEDALKNGIKFELSVSEHAKLRYAERVLGFDAMELIETIRNRVEPLAYLLGNCKVPIGNGHVAVVHDRIVVTIEPER